MLTQRLPVPWLLRKGGTSSASMMFNSDRGGMTAVTVDGASAIDSESLTSSSSIAGGVCSALTGGTRELPTSVSTGVLGV